MCTKKPLASVSLAAPTPGRIQGLSSAKVMLPSYDSIASIDCTGENDKIRNLIPSPRVIPGKEVSLRVFHAHTRLATSFSEVGGLWSFRPQAMGAARGSVPLASSIVGFGNWLAWEIRIPNGSNGP